MSKKVDSSRRRFLKVMSTGTCGAAVHQAIAPLSGIMAFAGAKEAQAAVGNLPVLVMVYLNGGCSYNITPIYNGQYRDLNPNVSYGPEDSHVLTGEQGLHPSLGNLKSIYDEGHLALVNLVGYPRPNRSHAESRDIWYSGIRDSGGGQGGWGARMTCQLGSAFAGVSFAGSSTLIQGDCNPPRPLGNLTSLGEDRFRWNDDATAWLRNTRSNMMLDADAARNGTQQYVRRSMVDLDQSLETLKEFADADLPVTFAGDSFSRQCADAARLIGAGGALHTQFIHVSDGGYDTHSGERSRLTSNLNRINAGLGSLVAACKAMGRWQDVIIAVMTEFSRTWENGSEGTDHGHAVPMLIMGGAISGGIKTPTPSTAEIAERNYFAATHTDFRQVFGELVRGMGLDPSIVFPEGYNPGGNMGLFLP